MPTESSQHFEPALRAVIQTYLPPQFWAESPETQQGFRLVPALLRPCLSSSGAHTQMGALRFLAKHACFIGPTQPTFPPLFLI